MDHAVEKMRKMLIGRPLAMMEIFNNVVRSFEAKLADEKKRADDAEQSVKNLIADFPKQSMKFSTEIGTKGD